PRQFDIEKIDKFGSDSSTNQGLVIHNKNINNITPQLLGMIREKFNLPFAFYNTTNLEITSDFTEGFSALIFRYDKRKIHHTESGMTCFKITKCLQPEDQNKWILDQLIDYFAFRNVYPQKEVVARIDNLTFPSLSIHFFMIMQKLGIRNFMVPFSLKNLSFIKELNKYFQEYSSENEKGNIPELEQWRSQIDVLDNNLIDILKQRQEIVHAMGTYKKQNNLPYFNPERWIEILKTRKVVAGNLNIDQDMIEKIFTAIHLNNLKTMIEGEN
ncbi:MAG TPA: chorismate mutase, partial [Bacteroidales bacterium]|nr:chorismate mutase [Bacteroidales bacterium]